MPACFDFSKPVIKPQVYESSSDNETTDNNHNLLDDNHNTIVTSKLSVSVYHTLCGYQCTDWAWFNACIKQSDLNSWTYFWSFTKSLRQEEFVFILWHWMLNIISKCIFNLHSLMIAYSVIVFIHLRTIIACNTLKRDYYGTLPIWSNFFFNTNKYC